MWRRTPEAIFARHHGNIRPVLRSLVSAVALVVTCQAQAGTPDILHRPAAPVAATTPYRAVNDDTVSLLTALIAIERDLLLGQLFLHDGMVNAEGSHFTHPRKETIPQIKDALAARGAPDLEPLLIALEEAKDVKAADAAYLAALAGVKRTKEALAPTGQDLLRAVILSAEEAHAMLDPSGTTGVTAYQEAWGMLMSARGELDALAFSSDPAVKQSAAKMVVAFDGVVLMAPDPAARAAVQFDPAVVAELIATIKGLVDSV
ncbi:MAG: hypothetical protein ACK4FR_01455 [Tabrizicola sp.]